MSGSGERYAVECNISLQILSCMGNDIPFVTAKVSHLPT